MKTAAASNTRRHTSGSSSGSSNKLSSISLMRSPSLDSSLPSCARVPNLPSATAAEALTSLWESSCRRAMSGLTSFLSLLSQRPFTPKARTMGSSSLSECLKTEVKSRSMLFSAIVTRRSISMRRRSTGTDAHRRSMDDTSLSVRPDSWAKSPYFRGVDSAPIFWK